MKPLELIPSCAGGLTVLGGERQSFRTRVGSLELIDNVWTERVDLVSRIALILFSAGSRKKRNGIWPGTYSLVPEQTEPHPILRSQRLVGFDNELVLMRRTWLQVLQFVTALIRQRHKRGIVLCCDRVEHAAGNLVV